jgi:hypothetical protein
MLSACCSPVVVVVVVLVRVPTGAHTRTAGTQRVCDYALLSNDPATARRAKRTLRTGALGAGTRERSSLQT